jgi:UDP-glucose 6-dehydrogenase
MWLVASRLGVDPDEVAGAVARSAEASLNPLYGIRGGAPFAGRCLPKDADGFLAFARELGLPMQMLGAVVGVNRHLGERVDGELEELTRSGARVLDLRDRELPVVDLRNVKPDTGEHDRRRSHDRRGSHDQQEWEGRRDAWQRVEDVW